VFVTAQWYNLGLMAWERVVNRKGILRLSYENQWEAHIYRVDGREIKKLRKVRIDDVT